MQMTLGVSAEKSRALANNLYLKYKARGKENYVVQCSRPPFYAFSSVPFLSISPLSANQNY